LGGSINISAAASAVIFIDKYNISGIEMTFSAGVAENYLVGTTVCFEIALAEEHLDFQPERPRKES
jgi:hypothetical protein